MPWQLCRWTGVLRKRGLGPDAVYLENVREIRGWGPLIAKRDKATGRVVKLDGTVAAQGERVPVWEQQLVRDPKRVGRHYRAWVKHMRGLGATYEDRDMCCADYGVPTSRKRLFGAALFGGCRPVWPEITHGHRTSEAVATGALLPHVPAASFIDWSLPLPSIFDRKKSLAPATMKRIAVGMKRFVLEAEKPFLISLDGRGEVVPYVAGVNNVSTRACRVFPTDDPLTTQCTVQGNALVGASVAPMFVSPNHTASTSAAARGPRAEAPGYTKPQHPGHAPAGAALIPTTHSKSPPRVHDAGAAAPTLTAAVKGGEIAVMAPTIIGAGGRAAQMPPIDIAGALNTSTTKEDRCVVAAHLTRYHGERRPGESRGVDLSDGLPTQTVENRFGVIAAHLTKFNENSIGQDPTGSIDTLMAGAARFGVVGSWMIQHNTGVIGHPAADSLSTMTTLGTQQQVAGAFLTEYYGTGGQHCAADEALNTLSTVDRFAVTGGHVDHPPLSPDQIARARQVAEFLRAHGVWNGGDIVTFGSWIVVDIGMRMLRPEEAAAAHELTMPDMIRVKQRDRKGNVVLDAEGREVWNERPLTKTEAMRLVGNSVPKRMARLLLECNGRASLVMEAAE